MAGRPKIFDEQEVINKATQVFWDKCYDAASSDELLSAMGIGKGSFYLTFKGGKQELYERSIQQFADQFYQNFTREITQSDNEIAFLKELFLSLANAPTIGKTRGCYLGNALVQLSEKDEHTQKIAAQLLKKLQKTFAQTIQKAQESGKMRNRENPEILGWHLCNLWNGIHVTRRMEKSPETLRELIELNFKLLE